MIIRQNKYRLHSGVSLIEAIIYVSLFVFLRVCFNPYIKAFLHLLSSFCLS